MLLVGQNGCRFELEVLGYQFPTIVDDEWDSNWLNIRTHARTERGGRSATDPSLLTSDVARLADWLQAIAEGRINAGDELEFMEPNLSFGLMGVPGDQVTLRIWLELESRPPWAVSSVVGDRDCWIDLQVHRDDLHRAADDLRAQVRKFPPRAVTA